MLQSEESDCTRGFGWDGSPNSSSSRLNPICYDCPIDDTSHSTMTLRWCFSYLSLETSMVRATTSESARVAETVRTSHWSRSRVTFFRAGDCGTDRIAACFPIPSVARERWGLPSGSVALRCSEHHSNPTLCFYIPGPCFHRENLFGLRRREDRKHAKVASPLSPR